MGIVEDVQGMAEVLASGLIPIGYRMDFSPASLWEIERFLDTEAPGGRARPDGVLAEQLGNSITGYGAALGLDIGPRPGTNRRWWRRR